jgi:6,7-dimethyl-8-ribityllumazine synthase
MATVDLSAYHADDIPSAEGMDVAVVVADWNREITHNLLEGAIATLAAHGALASSVMVWHVPGTFELANAAAQLADLSSVECVICLGCVIRGETPHFEYVCNAAAQGIMQVGITSKKPVIFGVLTDNNIEQSRARSGGELGNKGVEAAITAIRMTALSRRIASLKHSS